MKGLIAYTQPEVWEETSEVKLILNQRTEQNRGHGVMLVLFHYFDKTIDG